MQSAVSFAFIRGREGEIQAIHRLSPVARARVAIVVDLPTVELAPGKLLDEYIGGFVRQVGTAWGTQGCLYIDLTRYGPEQVDARGRNIVEHLFDCARQLKLRAIPVSGPLADRGPGTTYIDAVARIAATDGRGAALRLPYTDFSDTESLKREIDAGLSALNLSPNSVDLFLDSDSLVFLSPAAASEPVLLATLLQAMRVVHSYPFRNVVFAGSSVPDVLRAPAEGGPLIIARREFRVWKQFLELHDQPLVRFGDTGIWNPRQLDTGGGGGGPPPARVRIPLGDQQLFFRAEASSYRQLCQEALCYPGIHDLPRSWGLDAIRACAAGYGSVENATTWVARDTNLHMELTVIAAQEHLRKVGRLAEIPLAPVRSTPWQQESLVDALESERW